MRAAGVAVVEEPADAAVGRADRAECWIRTATPSSVGQRVSDALRDLPPVDALAAQVDAPRAIAVAAARAVLAERRAELLAGMWATRTSPRGRAPGSRLRGGRGCAG